MRLRDQEVGGHLLPCLLVGRSPQEEELELEQEKELGEQGEEEEKEEKEEGDEVSQ